MCRDKPRKQTQLVSDEEMSLLNAQFVNCCCRKLYSDKLTKRPGWAHTSKRITSYFFRKRAERLQVLDRFFLPEGLIGMFWVFQLIENFGVMIIQVSICCK